MEKIDSIKIPFYKKKTKSTDKCPSGEFTRTNITRGKSAPTKLKNQFPTHFLFIVNSTILYKNKIPFYKKKMKSIDKSPRG
jgi:hypothetical protein